MKGRKVLPIIFGLSMITYIFPAAVSGSIQDYMPPANAVEGYTLLWNNTRTVTNPFDASAGTITAGAQVWIKNESATITSVVGAVVIDMGKNNSFNEKISAALKITLAAIGINVDGDTLWDVLVACLALNESSITVITSQIKTTDSSVEFTLPGGGYFILSKDQNVIFFTFSFTVSSEWWTMAEGEITSIIDDAILWFGNFSSFWETVLGYLGGFSIPSGSSLEPIASGIGLDQMPSGDYTSSDDVQTVTTELGKLYTSAIPGYPLLVISVILGASIVLVAMKKKRAII
ncbi:MAG: hypothetical protein ACTSUE_08840 [Promethearchaeota archaeon]